MQSLITSAKEVLFSSTLGSLFVCLLAALCKNYSVDFHKIRWKCGTSAMEETVRFWWQSGSHYVMVRLGLGLGRGTATVHMGGCVTCRAFLNVNVP